MSKRSRFYPRVQVDATESVAVGQAGGVLLTDTVHLAGLALGLPSALAPWRKATAVHDPGKVVLDLATLVTSRARARSKPYRRSSVGSG